MSAIGGPHQKKGGVVLRFASDFEDSGLSEESAPGKYRLFEIDGSLGQRLLEGKETFHIKGGPNDEAVLCTSEETFEIKKKESSNTLLLIPKLDDQLKSAQQKLSAAPIPGGEEELNSRVEEVQVPAAMPNIYTMKKIAPRLGQLKTLLREGIYPGEDVANGTHRKRAKLNDGSSSSGVHASGNTYTFKELFDRVQCSEKELQEGLLSLNAFELHGKWRVFEDAYLTKLFDSILSTVVGNGMPVDCVSASTLAENLNVQGYLPEVIEKALSMFSNVCDEKGQYALDKTKVAKFRAKQLLSTFSTNKNAAVGDFKRWRMCDFMEEWTDSMFGLASASEMSDLLSVSKVCNDLATLERGCGDGHEYIQRFFASDLPEDATKRFAALFARRQKWEEGDIKPFIEGIVVTGNPLATLLLKNSRSSMVKPKPGTPHYPKSYRVYTAR